MEVLRYTKDVFGQKLLVGVSWDILWIPIVFAGVVIALHLLLRARRRAGQSRRFQSVKTDP